MIATQSLFPRILLVAGASLGAFVMTGCSGPDVTMPNPVVAGQLPSNHIVKTHGYAESHNGLPDGSMSDDAVLDAADKDQICVTVTLHELGAIDLGAAEVKLTTSTASVLQPTLAPEQPSSTTYPGLVPHTEQTGFRSVCQSNGTCNITPVYSTVMIPGPVTVYATRGRFCSPNQGLVTPLTSDMELRVVTQVAPHPGLMGHGEKKAVFRWAFAK